MERGDDCPPPLPHPLAFLYSPIDPLRRSPPPPAKAKYCAENPSDPSDVDGSEEGFFVHAKKRYNERAKAAGRVSRSLSRAADADDNAKDFNKRLVIKQFSHALGMADHRPLFIGIRTDLAEPKSTPDGGPDAPHRPPGALVDDIGAAIKSLRISSDGLSFDLATVSPGLVANLGLLHSMLRDGLASKQQRTREAADQDARDEAVPRCCGVIASGANKGRPCRVATNLEKVGGRWFCKGRRHFEKAMAGAAPGPAGSDSDHEDSENDSDS